MAVAIPINDVEEIPLTISPCTKSTKAPTA